MLQESNLHNYQRHSIEHVIENPFCGLFLDMGLGKTVSTLTAIDRIMFDRFEIKKVLLIAPLRVARDTWLDEVKGWAHVNHLKLSVCIGTADQRKAALQTKADVYTINRENVVWLTNLYGSKCPFDMLVVDELSSFKSSDAQRFKALKKWVPQFKRRVGLTGTPSPNGYLDLWAQLYILDEGVRLGKFKTHFIDRFFTIDPSTAYSTYPKKVLKPGAKEQIHGLISDICISMKAEDYLELHEPIHNVIRVHLSEAEMEAYEDFEKSQVLELPEGEISAMNAAALRTKLVQYANGAVYDANRDYHVVHEAKIEAAIEIVDVATSPVMIFYRFKHDLDRLQKAFKAYKPRMLNTTQDQKDWNEGKIKILLAHPASMGHGLNLQNGGNIILWFGDPESLELYQQANARLARQGQKEVVIINHLATVGTIDEPIMTALAGKATEQDALMEAVKAIVAKHKKPNP